MLFLSTQRQISADDWACFMGLDNALNTFACLFSFCNYAVAMTWLRFGYNRQVANDFIQNMPDEQYAEFMAQLAFMLCTEILNGFLIDKWFRYRVGALASLPRLCLLF